jgi:hypothetical protein
VSVRFRWRTYLRSALTEQSVVDLVHQYLETWKPEEVARLPAGVWPTSVKTGKDLVRETLRIGQIHSEFGGTRPALALLQELLLFMTQASVRVTQLMPLPGESEPLQRPVGGKVLTEEEKKLFEPTPQPGIDTARPVKDGEAEA